MSGQVLRPSELCALGQEALEEQLLLHGVHRRDARGSSRPRCWPRCPGPAPGLALLRAEVDEIPDDQKISAEPELLDQLEFLGQLPQHLARRRAVAYPRAIDRRPAQRRPSFRRRACGTRGIRSRDFAGKTRAARRAAWYCRPPRATRQKAPHLLRALEMALIVELQQPPGGVQVGVMPRAGEYIEHVLIVRRGVEDAVGGEQRELKRRAPGAAEAFSRRPSSRRKWRCTSI